MTSIPFRGHYRQTGRVVEGTLGIGEDCVWYQPTPYVKTFAGATNHVDSGWINSYKYYYNNTFVQDDKCVVGGWGDFYRCFIKFDIEGLPQNPSYVVMGLMSYNKGDGSTGTGIDLWYPSGPWNFSMSWATLPPLQMSSYIGGYNPPIPGQWWYTNITQPYLNWKSGVRPNYGLILEPWLKDNNFDMFRNTAYADESQRPFIYMQITPPAGTPNFKIPLDGNYSWRIGTEIGGRGCDSIDIGHTGPGFFSLDWERATLQDSQYNRNTNTPIPILSVGDGYIANIIPNNATGGNIVEVRHGEKNTPAYISRYLHMSTFGNIYMGQKIPQGKVLGYMGATPIGVVGFHLDFNIQYDDLNGSTSQKNSSSVGQLSYFVMDGWLMKSFQVECDNTSKPSTRWYKSNNTPIY